MCESSHEDNSADLASSEAIQKIWRACKYNKVRLGASAQSNLQRWRIGSTDLQTAVVQHIDAGRKFYKKYKKGVLLEKNFDANVTIYEGKDVYVEMILTGSVFIILNAHEHTMHPRLPQ